MGYDRDRFANASPAVLCAGARPTCDSQSQAAALMVGSTQTRGPLLLPQGYHTVEIRREIPARTGLV